MSCRTFAFYLFLLVAGVTSQTSEEGKVAQHCLLQNKATKEIKSWAKSIIEEEGEHYSIEFFDTSLSVIQNSEGVAWHIVSDGLQGAFYFESKEKLEDESESDKHGAYLYPDYSTAILGVWRDHLLVNGRTTHLVEACRSGTVWTLKFGELEGPILTYSPPSHYSYGVHPLQRDPYEEKTVEVQVSLLPGATDGLFTKRYTETGDILAFYGGYMISCNSSLRALDRQEYSDVEEHQRNMYSLSLGLDEEDNFCLDLPPELGNDVAKYNATLGHKLNHSFEPNVEFYLFSVHPVLGTIMSLSALEDIPAGSELTVNYGYDLEADPDQPQWFRDQWVNYYGEVLEGSSDREDMDDAEGDEHEEL